VKTGAIDGKKFQFVLVFNGENGWVMDDGLAKDLNEKLLAEVREEIHLLNVRRLTSLTNRSYDLTTLSSTQINNRPADGIRVAAKGFREISLYFDRASGLLVKLERHTVGPLKNQAVVEERLFSDYRKIDGVQSPRKTVVNLEGKKFLEVNTLEVKFLQQMDPSTFQRP
jgi:hypothetical protein